VKTWTARGYVGDFLPIEKRHQGEETMAHTVEIGHNHDVTFEDIVNVAKGAEVTVNKATDALLSTRRDQVKNYIRDTGQPAYGFNRGFGSNVHLEVAPENLTALQENLIRSHACCVGEAAPPEVVRGTMFLRAKSLALGYSAVRPIIVHQLVEALNKGLIPVVPSFGSVSASGDLAPLSHIALCLFLGEGQAFIQENAKHQGPMPAPEALKKVGLETISLEMKEGLALNNGVQYSTSLCALATDALGIILKTATVATALVAQVMLAADTPFRRDLHNLRRHRGSQVIADCIFQLMAGSPLREAHLPYDIDGEIQDPYNLRCAAQILGPCLELLWRAKRTIVIEANSVTDNPIILQATRDSSIERKQFYLGQYVEIVSGGHFHGMPIAVDAFGLIQAASIIARLSNMRCVRFVDADRNKGLGPDLKWPGRVPPGKHWDNPNQYNMDDIGRHQSMQSAMMIPEYTSAALTNWIWGQAMPNHLFSLSTDSGQEDHASMAANVAIKAFQIMPRLAEIVAIELAFAAQAAAIRKQAPAIPSRAPKHDLEDPGAVKDWHKIQPQYRMLSDACEKVLQVVENHFPAVKRDRNMSAEIASLSQAVLNGDIMSAAGNVADFFGDFSLPADAVH
jgi:histidine ammonia-lyase